MVDASVVKSVRNYLTSLQREGFNVCFGIVFGSYASGKTDRWSDIDLLVVSPRFDGSRSRKDIDLLWRLAAKSDARIEPIPCGEHQWYEDETSAIVEIARREGETISLAQ
jgi:predicted nucleotidyltransferase